MLSVEVAELFILKVKFWLVSAVKVVRLIFVKSVMLLIVHISAVKLDAAKAGDANMKLKAKLKAKLNANMKNAAGKTVFKGFSSKFFPIFSFSFLFIKFLPHLPSNFTSQFCFVSDCRPLTGTQKQVLPRLHDA